MSGDISWNMAMTDVVNALERIADALERSADCQGTIADAALEANKMPDEGDVVAGDANLSRGLGALFAAVDKYNAEAKQPLPAGPMPTTGDDCSADDFTCVRCGAEEATRANAGDVWACLGCGWLA
jgi:hypothetical protein